METAVAEAPVVPNQPVDHPIDDNSADATATANKSIDKQSSSDTAQNNANGNNSNNNNSNKKDRKTRRQGLPLPEVIPEEPLKPYEPPSKEELQKKVDAEQAKLNECFARLNQTRTFYEERQKIREKSKPIFDAARKEFQQLSEECRNLFEERKSMTARIKELRENATRGASSVFSELTGAGKDGTEALKDVKNMNDLESRIQQYQYRLETESMSILEEKKLVAKISFLAHKGRDFIREKDQSEKNAKAESEARKASRAELEQKRTLLDARIDATKEKMETKKKELDDIRAKQTEQESKLSKASPTVDRDEEKKKIDEIRGVIRKLRDEFQKQLDEWYLNKRIIVEQQKIARKKKYDAIQAEREEKRKAWEAEQAQYPEPHPYQAQKDMCAGLIIYMKTLLGETIEKPTLNLRAENGVTSAAPSLKSSGAAREIVAPGKAFGKSANANDTGFEDLAFSKFVKKSKKGRKSRGKPNNASSHSPVSASASTNGNADGDEAGESQLKPHSIDYLTAFSVLGIKPPNKLNEVRAALEAVQSKAAFYETAPAPTDEEKAEPAKKENGNASGSGGINNRKLNKSSGGASSSNTNDSSSSNGKGNSGEKKAANGNVDIINGDASSAFPGLGSENGNSGSRVRALADSMPSFKAVASGDAQAPVLTGPTPGSSLNVDAVVENGADGENGEVDTENGGNADVVEEKAVGEDNVEDDGNAGNVEEDSEILTTAAAKSDAIADADDDSSKAEA